MHAFVLSPMGDVSISGCLCSNDWQIWPVGWILVFASKGSLEHNQMHLFLYYVTVFMHK